MKRALEPIEPAELDRVTGGIRYPLEPPRCGDRRGCVEPPYGPFPRPWVIPNWA